MCSLKHLFLGFPGGSVVGKTPASSGDTCLISGREDPRVPWSRSATAAQLLRLCSRARELPLRKSPLPRTHALQRRSDTVRSRTLQLEGSWRKLEKNPHNSEGLVQPTARKNINKEKNLLFCFFLLYYHQFSGKKN